VDTTVDELPPEQTADALSGADEAVRSGCEREMVQAHTEILGVLSGTPDAGVGIS
jgi:hypothetical protein